MCTKLWFKPLKKYFLKRLHCNWKIVESNEQMINSMLLPVLHDQFLFYLIPPKVFRFKRQWTPVARFRGTVHIARVTPVNPVLRKSPVHTGFRFSSSHRCLKSFCWHTCLKKCFFNKEVKCSIMQL